MFFCNLLMILLIALWALLSFTNSADGAADENSGHILNTTDREARGFLAKHFHGSFPNLFQTSGAIATSNTVSLFGKYLTSAFALTYGTGKSHETAHDPVHEDKSYVAIRTISNSKPTPIDIVIINQPDMDNSLGSYAEDNEITKNMIVNKIPTDKSTGKNIIALKEKNGNLMKIISTIAKNYSISLKEIVPFDNVPLDLKTKMIKDIIKAHDTSRDPCYIIVINGDRKVLSDILKISGITITKLGRDTKPNAQGKALNVFELQQVEEIKKKLNITTNSGTTDSNKHKKDGYSNRNSACGGFTVYVF